MKPNPHPRDALDVFQSHFDQLLDPRHELPLLANEIDWPGLEASFVDTCLPGRRRQVVICCVPPDEGDMDVFVPAFPKFVPQTRAFQQHR